MNLSIPWIERFLRRSAFAVNLCAIGIIGAGLSSPASAAVADGSKIVLQIDHAKTLLSQIKSGKICSKTYFSNATLLADCTAYYNDLTNTVNAWETLLKEGKLTVAYDTTTETNIYDYEVDLKAVLADAGYVYAPHPVPPGRSIGRAANPESSADQGAKLGEDSPAFQISPADDFSPDENSTNCSNCDKVAAAGAIACGTVALKSPAAGIACGIVIYTAYTVCVYAYCVPPKDPPKECSLVSDEFLNGRSEMAMVGRRPQSEFGYG